MWSAHCQLRDVAVRHRIVVVLGDLVQTTAGKWITQPPMRLHDHPDHALGRSLPARASFRDRDGMVGHR